MGILALIQLGYMRIFILFKRTSEVYTRMFFKKPWTSITRNKNEMIVKLMTTITKYIKMIRHMSNENSL
nr:ssDNA-binding protein [Bacillus thuringiensis]